MDEPSIICARALFGFGEALKLWPENNSARTGRSAARAASALRKGDFDLGLSLLPADDPAQTVLRGELSRAKKERAARQQRLKALRRSVTVGTALFIAVLIGGSW